MKNNHKYELIGSLRNKLLAHIISYTYTCSYKIEDIDKTMRFL